MIQYPDVFSYIQTEKNNWRTARIPLTRSKDWNMYEHIERCKNVANGWFHKGNNDGMRPYNDLVTPIIDVGFRLEGFDVKDIVPFVNDSANYYKSFLIKKYHPQWARKHELDTFIDEVVESSIIYDLVLIKHVNGVRPEVVDLASIAFCDQTDVLRAPLCIEHNYSVSELLEMRGKWDDDVIKQAIMLAPESLTVGLANDRQVKTNAKVIKVYELRGLLPENWLKDDGDPLTFTDQMHVVCFYSDEKGNKQGLTLYKGVDKPLADNFKALKIDQVRSKGRACGKSIVERLFEPQVWNNYAGIKLKELLDSAVNVIITDSEELGNQKLSDLKVNTLIKQERGATTQRLDGSLQNIQHFQNYQVSQENAARILGSASDGSLGRNPTSGTPFALQQLIVQEGQGIHDYRQGKIASFFADVLYRDWFLKDMVRDMNGGKRFSEELTLEEMSEIAEIVATNEAEEEIKNMILDGKIPTPEIRAQLVELKKEDFKKGGTRRFMEVMEGELKDLPLEVFVNIKGKQRRMAENADKITNIIREVVANPQAFSAIPGVGKVFNELLEESGFSPIDFSQITKAMPTEGQEQLSIA